VPKNKCPCLDNNGKEVPPGTVYQDHCKTCMCTDGKYGCTTTPGCTTTMPTTKGVCPWSNWATWSDCDKDCGPGSTRTRSRVQITDDYCDSTQDTDTQTSSCPDVPCPNCVVDGVVYADGEHIPSTEQCLYCFCDRKNSTYAEETCQTDTNKIVNCGWADWSDWGGCTVTCGSGTRYRRRTCDNPLAQCGGIQNTTDSDSEPCNTITCQQAGTSTTTGYCPTCAPTEKCVPEYCEPTCETIINNLPCVTKIYSCVCPTNTVRDELGNCVPPLNCNNCIIGNKTYVDGQVFTTVDNNTCTETNYKCSNNVLVTLANSTTVTCNPCPDSWTRSAEPGNCCKCIPYANNQTEGNCTISTNQVVPLNITFSNGTSCQSVYNAKLYSCVGCCSSYDEIQLTSSVNGASITNGVAVGGYYDFNSSPCSRCQGQKVMTYFPMICGPRQSLMMIGLPEIQSCACTACCGDGGCGQTVSTPMAVTCKKPTIFSLSAYDSTYVFINATASKTPDVDSTVPGGIRYYNPEYAFANANGLFYKATLTSPNVFAFTVTLNATKVASVGSISFHQKQAVAIQVSWASVNADGSISSSTVSLTGVNPGSSTNPGSSHTVPINAPISAFTIYAIVSSPTSGGRLDSLVINANVCQ